MAPSFLLRVPSYLPAVLSPPVTTTLVTLLGSFTPLRRTDVHGSAFSLEHCCSLTVTALQHQLEGVGVTVPAEGVSQPACPGCVGSLDQLRSWQGLCWDSGCFTVLLRSNGVSSEPDSHLAGIHGSG